MNMVIKMVVFTMALNLAAGLMIISVVDIDGNRIFDEDWTRSGISYDSQMLNDYESDTNTTVNPSTGAIQDSGDADYRILDMLNLGLIGRLLNLIENFMFGFLNILESMFKPLFGSISGTVFGTLKGIVIIGYIWAAFSLFTGKEVNR